jgi:hypothetical protein
MTKPQEYSLLATVFVLSAALAFALPTTELLRGIAGLPAVGTLFFVVWQIFREDAAHRRQIELEHQKQFFGLTVTSHMASVAFDKHVAFCEEYIARVNHGVKDMVVQGPSREALAFSRQLLEIRVKHAPWVSPDI